MKPALNVRKLKRNPTLKGCEVCNFKYPGSEVNCRACGQPLVDLPPSACIECGAELDPGEETCSVCELKTNKAEIRPLVEAAVIGDGRLSKLEKDCIIRTAKQSGIDSQVAETLIAELLPEFGAVDECYIPILAVEPLVIRFLGVEGISRQQYLKIENTGGGEMTGMVISNAAWLRASPNILNSKVKDQTVTLNVNADLLPGGFSEKGLVQVETNGGKIDVDVYVEAERPQVKPISAHLKDDRLKTKPIAGREAQATSENRDVAASDTEPISNQKKAKSKSAGLILALAAVLVALVVITKWAGESSSAVARVNDKLSKGQLVMPVGNSAYDLWLDLRSKNPSSSAVAEISKGALPLLTSRGEQVIRRWHDEARADDQEWYEVSRTYEWASLIEPANKELQALKNYSYGQIAFRDKRFEDALKAYSQAIQNKQCMSLAYNGIGRVYANKRDYANAEVNYKKALECEPGWCYPYANLGGVYLQTNQYPLAESYYAKAASYAPNKPSIHYQLGLLYEGWKRYCDAVSEYRKALDLVHNDPDPGFAAERLQKRVSVLEARCR